jgi:hypothetical protein
MRPLYRIAIAINPTHRVQCFDTTVAPIPDHREKLILVHIISLANDPTRTNDIRFGNYERIDAWLEHTPHPGLSR